MGLPARDTIIAHNLFLGISIGCVNKVHPPLVCPVCESGGRGCPRDSVIQVVLCIIIVPGLMNKEPPPPPPPQLTTSLRPEKERAAKRQRYWQSPERARLAKRVKVSQSYVVLVLVPVATYSC